MADEPGSRGSSAGSLRDDDRADRELQLLSVTEELAKAGGWEYDLVAERVRLTEGTRRIHGIEDGVDPTPASVLDVYHPEDRPTVEAAIERARERGEPFDETVRLVRAADDVRWVQIRGKAVREDGEIVCLQGAIRDVTERRETEAQLRERETHLEHAQAVADMGSWVRDVPANEIWWSEEVYNIFGLDRSEGPLDHGGFMSFVHPEDRDAVEDAWTAALDGAEYDITHRIVVDGEIRWVREEAELEFDADGDPQRAIGVVQDVTDQVTSKRRVETQNEQLQVLNRILRHDLRNQMNVVLGYAEALSDRLDDERQDFAEEICAAADELLAISDEVRGVRQVLENDRRPIDVTPLVSGVLESVREEFPDAEYEVAVPESLWATATPGVRIALRNVIENAVDHNDSADPRVSVAAEQDGDRVAIRVSDNGPGIPESEYEHLDGQRERSQLDHTSGLGLWTVTWIVADSGGEVNFDTDDGTTVTIRLPRADPPS